MASESVAPSHSQTKRPVRQLTSDYSYTSLFDNDAKIKLLGLTLASNSNSEHPNDFEEAKQSIASSTENDAPQIQLTVSDVMFCNCCQVQFADREEQRIHYSCDWHRYNLHLRLKGLKCVSEDEFELVSGDVSSISGSEEDSESENVELNQKVPMPLAETPVNEGYEDSMKDYRSHKILFKNDQGELLALHRCLLSHKKNPVKSSSDLLDVAIQLVHQQRWAVLMVSSGHFAGAIFNGKEVVDHKTFHRYTVRAKRGTAQSSRDGQGHAPKSAGASIRRYNEAALSQEVQELMTSWQSHLASCSFIFARIPVSNRAMFYGGKNPALKKDDLRIRIIPFTTRRPTFSEVKRVQQMLSSIESYGQESDVKDFIPLSPQRFYCKDTDQLEIRCPNQTPKKTNHSDVNQDNIPPEVSVDTNAEQESEEELEEDDFEIYPVGPGNLLEEFETHMEKKRRKRKNKPGKSKTPNPMDSPSKDNEDEAQLAMKNSLFTACKTGNVEDLRTILSDLHIFCDKRSPSEDVTCDNNEKCEKNNEPQDASLERDSLTSDDDASKSIVSNQKVADFLSCTMGDIANTFLHYASQDNHHEIISILLHEGADPTIKNKNGRVPYNLGNNEAKNTYRRFMGLFPEKHDYKQAQIPSPLTPEMEAMKKDKHAQRRAVKKKSTQEKNKVKKAEELKQKEEDEIKERFLNLSDREKRALAAERRILQQHSEHGSTKPVLSRCFQCGEDMTGKVPFDYCDFKFCSTKCLREHRAKSKS